MYDSYGKKCNTRFLLNYGFINLNNDANEFPLVVRLKTSQPSFETKYKMIKEDCKTFRVMTDFTESVMYKFLSFIRFVEYEDNLNTFHLMTDQWVNPEDDSHGEPVFRADKISS